VVFECTKKWHAQVNNGFILLYRLKTELYDIPVVIKTSHWTEKNNGAWNFLNFQMPLKRMLEL
jgi:hypothetical protein